jgi:hypothetical protein
MTSSGKSLSQCCTSFAAAAYSLHGLRRSEYDQGYDVAAHFSKRRNAAVINRVNSVD